MAEKKEKQYVSDNARLMAEWDWEKNSEVGYHPNELTSGSVKKIFWKCSLGHGWQATPNNRSRGQGCPICAGRVVSVGFNDLSSKFPHIAEEWHSELNDISPQTVTSHSHKVVWWKCKQCGNEWQSSVSNRAAGKGCPICSKTKQGKSKVANIIAQKGSFSDIYPHLLEEWDYNKNTISPQSLTQNSSYKAWWKCSKCHHSWQTTVQHRTVRNSGCPACQNKVTTKENCLAQTHPHLIAKWNYQKNIEITPNDLTAGSNKKVWWNCEKGHEWKATVWAIVNGGLCPICCGQQALEGYNDLQNLHPDIAKEWHPFKNAPLLPTQITSGSSKSKIWWVCRKGHEYQATVASRTRGTNCPFCDKENKTSFPEQAIYFYLNKITRAENRYLLNGNIEIDIFLPDINIGIEYDGYYYHSGDSATQKEEKKNVALKEAGIYLIRVKEIKNEIVFDSENVIYCINNGNGAFISSVIDRLLKRINLISGNNWNIDVDAVRDSSLIYSQYIENEKTNSLAVKNPKLASEWHPTNNGFVTPNMVSYYSGKKAWWICDKGHEWQSAISNRVAGGGCPICSNKKVLIGYNDLNTTHSELVKEWDFSKNTITPQEITYGSDKKVWWICPNNHSYLSSVSNHIYGKGCPICSIGKRSLSRHRNHLSKSDSLAITHPELCREWCFDKNLFSPNQYTYGSDEKVWWICNNGHQYEASIANRVYGKGCPICAGKKIVKGINDLATLNPKLVEEWDFEKNEIDPQTISPNSHKKAWWKCKEGHSWQAQIKSRNQGCGCPECAKQKRKNKDA